MGRGGGWRWSCAGRARFPLAFLPFSSSRAAARSPRRAAMRCEWGCAGLASRGGKRHEAEVVRDPFRVGLVRGGIINQRLPEKQNN